MINENDAADNEYGDVEDDGVDEDDEEDDEGFYNMFFFVCPVLSVYIPIYL